MIAIKTRCGMLRTRMFRRLLVAKNGRDLKCYCLASDF